MLDLALHEIKEEPDDNRQRDEKAEGSSDAGGPEFDTVVFRRVSGGKVIGGSGKTATDETFRPGLFAVQPIQNTARFFLALASRTAGILAYASLLAFTHDLPASSK